MSYQEKSSILSIISTVIIFTLYCFFVVSRLAEGGVELLHNLSYWAKVILVFIPISVVARIAIEIIFVIINAIITQSDKDPSFTDERDTLISLKSGRISSYVIGVGFLISMITLAVELPPFVMFNVIFLSFNLGEIIERVVQLYFYNRGF
jgi:hypothetical protein